MYIKSCNPNLGLIMFMQTEMDRLSALPDDLLIRILSRLDVKEAARTSLLSKRWRFVWTDLPRLRFYEKTGQIEAVNRFKAGVYGALAGRRGAALNCLSLDFSYNNYFMGSDVDVWVELAAKNKVQHLDLNLYSGSRIGEHYTLHHTMYSNSWLKQLDLRFFIMPPPTAVEWRSMTEISLHHCTLPQQVIDQVISGCPALSRLGIYGCSEFNRLEIGGRSFRSLNIDLKEQGLLEISAPYMTHLNVAMIPTTRTLRLTNVVSLQRVDLCLRQFRSTLDDEPLASLEELTTNNAYQIFDAIRCANTLVLLYGNLKVVSMMATNGRQLPKFEAGCMEIYPDDDALNIHGIILILQSSPFLERLSIYGSSDIENGMDAIALDPAIQCNLNCDLLHLKSVRIEVYADSENSCKSTFKLAHTLLKRAPMLVKMEIYISASTNLKDVIEKFETLLCYPRCSHKARIVISELEE